MDMDISMDIHAKSVDMDMDMGGKFHIHGNPGNSRCSDSAFSAEAGRNSQGEFTRSLGGSATSAWSGYFPVQSRTSSTLFDVVVTISEKGD